MSQSRTTKLLSQLDQHFGKCAVLAAAGVGAGMVSAPQTAEAAIVHSGIINLATPTTTNGLYINLVTWAANPGGAGTYNEPGNTGGGTVPGWDLNIYGGTQLFWSGGQLNWGYVGTGAGTVAQLAAGAVVDGTTVNLTNTGSASAFPAAAPGAYAGFRFFNETAQCAQFAWIRYFRPAGAAGTLVEYAYEDTCGGAIQAGSVPEPGSLALLAMGAAGMLIRRRK